MSDRTPPAGSDVAQARHGHVVERMSRPRSISSPISAQRSSGVQAAASSIASGRPSTRRQIRTTCGRRSSVSAKEAWPGGPVRRTTGRRRSRGHRRLETASPLDVEDPLGLDAEALPGCGQQTDAGRLLDDLGEERSSPPRGARGCRGRAASALAQEVDELLACGGVAVLEVDLELERGGHRSRQEVGRGDRHERDEVDPVLVAVGDAAMRPRARVASCRPRRGRRG